MKKQKTILFYCQHSLGMGHLVRALALAEKLAENARVVFLNGGRMPRKIRIPARIEIVNLPPVGFDAEKRLVSQDRRRRLERALEVRRERILETYRRKMPAAVIVELFPFGRKKFAAEILPLLAAAKGKSLIFCSLRDILVGQRHDQQKHDERAAETANRFFDAILLHADEKFARLEETFRSAADLEIPVFYTGFAAKNETLKRGKPAAKRVVVSAGGGIVGEKLFRAAIASKAFLPVDIEMKIIAGAFLPEIVWHELLEKSRGVKNLQLRRFVPDLAAEMAEASVSVSQCGYNTVLDIVRSGVAALVVPFAESGEDEQMNRARRLAKLGALRLLENENPTPEKLASEIENTLDFRPVKNVLDLDGAAQTARIVKNLLAKRKPNDRGENAWLAPVRDALEARSKPIRVFFRDDDAGWNDARLFKLLEIFRFYRMPLDVAVIPTELNRLLAKKLSREIENGTALFSVHQHGFSHANHETEGRKCEFGAARPFQAQFADIARGREILQSFFGDLADEIFTPPWNRCQPETGEILRALGFKILSREAEAAPLGIENLKEISISVDWFAKRKGVKLNRIEIGERLARQIAEKETLGVMFHHALMDADERKYAGALLEMLAESCMVAPYLMRDAANAEKLLVAKF